jgi:ribosome-associated protein
VARRAVEAASEKQADNIVMLDARQICSFTDYFVICSGETDRQITAIQEEIRSALKSEGILAHHSEGTADSGWVLLDLGSVIVHIFSPQMRDYYKLDDLWNKASPVIRIQ